MRHAGLPVVFEPVQVSSGEHYKVLLYEKITFKPYREHVFGYEVRVQITTNAWVFSHEHAHCFGVPDEYPYSEPEDVAVERLVYIRPEPSRTRRPARSPCPSRS
jgi:type VI secretion system secreted protein VgrG